LDADTGHGNGSSAGSHECPRVGSPLCL